MPLEELLGRLALFGLGGLWFWKCAAYLWKCMFEKTKPTIWFTITLMTASVLIITSVFGEFS